ncbi:MAG: hypothetical protein ABFS86_00740 [Planctomycetota bacterium]
MIPILERLQSDHPELREALEARRRIHADAAGVRESCLRQEEPIRRWEIEVREKSPSGPRWNSMLEDGKTLLTSAGGLYATILGDERDALEHLRKATDLLRSLLAQPDVDLDPRLPEMLEQCARLREQEIRWLEEIVNLTGRIESLNGEATPDQVRSLLTLRGRFLDQVNMLRETSSSLEERACSLESVVAEGPEAGEETNGSTVEEILDVEFEDLDQKLRSFSDERDQALRSLASVEAKFETEAERREDLERRLAAAENRIALGEERIRAQDAAADAARREKDEIAGRLKATEGKLVAETARREALEADLRKTEEDRDKTLALLAEAEARAVAAQSEFDEERKLLRNRIDEAKGECERTEARRLDELKRLREAVRGLTSRVDDEIRGFEDEA